MKVITYSSEYFNPQDTLLCGQIFRYYQTEGGYIVVSRDKACKIYQKDNLTYILCENEHEQYFVNYFDLSTDYGAIYGRALNSKHKILQTSATLGKGVRILRQDSEETLFSFLISQNNNIPRIKTIINRICESLGEKREFLGFSYYTFPTTEKILSKSEQFYKDLGLGYRAEYLLTLAKEISLGLIERLSGLSGEQVKNQLVKIKGVGEKVANCAMLFGFYKTDCFPVDVWIEKIYREDFKGEIKNRNKITEYFTNEFGLDSGYFQQYLFYYKRSLEKKE